MNPYLYVTVLILAIVLILVFAFGCTSFDAYEFPPEAYESKLEWAADNTPIQNCFTWSRTVHDKLESVGEDSIILAIERYPIDHAIVCDEINCADNGTLGFFPRAELSRYKILGSIVFLNGVPMIDNGQKLTQVGY